MAVESRMVSEDSDYTLFVERLNLVKDEDFEETHYPLFSVPAVRNIIDISGDKPFNDIPNIPTIAYDDSELSLWAALLADYRNVVMRVPKYANIMVRSGIPPALRGFAWKSMAEAGSPTLDNPFTTRLPPSGLRLSKSSGETSTERFQIFKCFARMAAMAR